MDIWLVGLYALGWLIVAALVACLGGAIWWLIRELLDQRQP